MPANSSLLNVIYSWYKRCRWQQLLPTFCYGTKFLLQMRLNNILLQSLLLLFFLLKTRPKFSKVAKDWFFKVLKWFRYTEYWCTRLGWYDVKMMMYSDSLIRRHDDEIEKQTNSFTEWTWPASSRLAFATKNINPATIEFFFFSDFLVIFCYKWKVK